MSTFKELDKPLQIVCTGQTPRLQPSFMNGSLRAMMDLEKLKAKAADGIQL